MNNLDDLRDAMHTTPDFEPRPLDLAVVMAAGGRLRRRRQLAVGAASGLAVLALLVGGAQFLGPQAVSQPPAAPAPAAPTPATSTPATSAATATPAVDPDPTSVDDASGEVLGEVVTTGLRDGDAERVLWVVSLEAGASFGIGNGRRLADGSLRRDILANESDGAPRAPGFHAAQAAMNVDGRTTLAYGYYAGPATRITVQADGSRRIDAKLATWSEDPSIVLFWFTPDQVKPGAKLGTLTAFDRNGRKLPAGHPTFAVG